MVAMAAATLGRDNDEAGAEVEEPLWLGDGEGLQRYGDAFAAKGAGDAADGAAKGVEAVRGGRSLEMGEMDPSSLTSSLLNPAAGAAVDLEWPKGLVRKGRRLMIGAPLALVVEGGAGSGGECELSSSCCGGWFSTSACARCVTGAVSAAASPLASSFRTPASAAAGLLTGDVKAATADEEEAAAPV